MMQNEPRNMRDDPFNMHDERHSGSMSAATNARSDIAHGWLADCLRLVD